MNIINATARNIKPLVAKFGGNSYKKENGKFVIFQAGACDACDAPHMEGNYFTVPVSVGEAALSAFLTHYPNATDLGCDEVGNTYCERCYQTHAVNG